MPATEKKLVWWGYLILGALLVAMGLFLLDLAPGASSESRQARGYVLAWISLIAGPFMVLYGISLKLRGKSRG
ncbi:hypothetical protein [Georgenia sunbinii]|uniref:hypothetical protein n=1 Tax=Georgenia sunbinii TaxID=3117728 RepID=UPI002F26CCC5